MVFRNSSVVHLNGLKSLLKTFHQVKYLKKSAQEEIKVKRAI